MKGQMIIDKTANDGSMKGRFIKQGDTEKPCVFEELGIDVVA